MTNWNEVSGRSDNPNMPHRIRKRGDKQCSSTRLPPSFFLSQHVSHDTSFDQHRPRHGNRCANNFLIRHTNHLPGNRTKIAKMCPWPKLDTMICIINTDVTRQVRKLHNGSLPSQFLLRFHDMLETDRLQSPLKWVHLVHCTHHVSPGPFCQDATPIASC